MLTTGVNYGIIRGIKELSTVNTSDIGIFLYPHIRGIRAENTLNIRRAFDRALIASPVFAFLKRLLKTIGGLMRHIFNYNQTSQELGLTTNPNNDTIGATNVNRAVSRSTIWGMRTPNILNKRQMSTRFALVESPAYSNLGGKTKKTEVNMILTFNNKQLTFKQHKNQLWLDARNLARGLGYNDDRSVNRIYARHSDEFTADMTCGVKLTPQPTGAKTTRVFSPRGCHLIAMFAKTPFAKDFRKWVLDVLEHIQLNNDPQPDLFVAPPSKKPAIEKPALDVEGLSFAQLFKDARSKNVEQAIQEYNRRELIEATEALKKYGVMCYNLGTLDAVFNLKAKGRIKV